MIVIDMRMPVDCVMCPMSYLVQTGKLANKTICSVLNFRDERAEACLVDTTAMKRPDKCPLMEIGEASHG